MDPPQLRTFQDQVGKQLFHHILPFWTGPALDFEAGGWLPWLSNDLKLDRSQPKGLIVNTRILWTFSAVHRLRNDPLYRQMAERAFEFVLNCFWDPEHGGALWRIDSSGKVVDASKKSYGQAFCIYALAEFHRAFGSPEALQRAIDLFQLLEQHAFDPVHRGYWEVRNRDWSEAIDTRLSEKDLNEKKSMNNHLHLLEAYANLYRVWQNPLLKERLRELIRLFEERILDRRTWHLRHFFDERWQVRSVSYTFGHDIEASWLLCEAAQVLQDAALLSHVREVALKMAETVREQALGADGGLAYEGRDGQVIDPGRESWPQAEALVGFTNAFQISGDPEYLEAANRVWNFIERHMVDRVHGEWFWRITPDGKPDPALPKVSEWKGPYHGSRACLETLRRLNEISP